MSKNNKKNKNKKAIGLQGKSTIQDLPDIAPPKIIFDAEVYYKIMHWVEKSTDEVSGLGTVEQTENGDFQVISAMMLPQKNTGGSTDIEAEDVAKAMYELRNEKGSLNFWWHSHVNMATFWSKTDTDTIQMFGNAGGQGGFVVATVFNKKSEKRSALYFNANLASKNIKIFLDEVETKVITFLKDEDIKKWDAEYDKNVKKEIVKPWSVSKYGHWDDGKWYPNKEEEGDDKSFNDDDYYDNWYTRTYGKKDSKVDPISMIKTGEFERPSGFITLAEKFCGLAKLWDGRGSRLYPIDRLGNCVGHPIWLGTAIDEVLLNKLAQKNLSIKDRDLKDGPEDRMSALRLLTDIELDRAAEIHSISDDEYFFEVERRLPKTEADETAGVTT